MFLFKCILPNRYYNRGVHDIPGHSTNYTFSDNIIHIDQVAL